MANTIKLKRGSGSDPGSSDLSVGELAVRTDTAKLFTKNDGGSVVEVSGGVDDGDKGDITVSSSGATWTIDNDAVTYAKIQNVSATDRLLGRDSSGAGVIEEIAPSAVRTMLGLATSATTDTTNASNISSGTLAAARVATLNQDTSGNAATATALETARTIAGVSFDGSANISLNNNAITNGAGYITATLTEEQVEDFVGGMVTGNTETGITVTYQDSDGTLDFVVATQSDNNFTTTLKNKLDGIAASATNVTNNNQLTNGASYVTSSIIDSLNGSNIDSGTVAAARVATLNQNTTGSAATLTTSRNFSISGEATVSDTSFNGSADCDMTITIDNNVIDEANLKVSNSPTNGYVLTARSGNTGGMTWEEASGGGATGGSSDKIFHENGQTVTANYTIGDTLGAACNAMSAGPITVNSGVTVTIGSGEYWIIV